MASNIFPYPTLTPALVQEIRYEMGNLYQFSFEMDGEIYYLQTEALEGKKITHWISPQRVQWTPDGNHLILNRHYSLKDYQILFGEGGVGCSDATLGLAFSFKSSDSKLRGTVPIGEFCKDSGDLDFDFEYRFEKASIRGQIELTTLLYLKDPGIPDEDEEYFAKIPGSILGVLDEYFLQIDGTGSLFPISMFSEKNGPLWKFEFNWTDPREDLLADEVELYLNEAHKDYKYVDPGRPRLFNPQLMQQIMLSMLQTMIMKLKYEDPETWNDIYNGKELETGSIGEAVHYFIEQLEWDVKGPEEIANSIRDYLDGKVEV